MQNSGYSAHFTIFLEMVRPAASSMLISIALADFQSKQYKRFARASSTIVTPISIPGQPLRPDPNGKNSKCCPF
jgi:Ni/Fe-hydrogenase subunit HybB-like protein